MQEYRSNEKFNRSVLLISMMLFLFCCFHSTAFAGTQKVTYPHNFDASVLPDVARSGANEWQIMKGSYNGGYDGSDVSNGFDETANVNYTDDDMLRLTKNVVSTDTENEFLMYLSVEPQVSWEEVLQLNTIMVTNANKNVSPPNWPTAGQPSYLKPEKDAEYTVPVQIEYYAIENGKKIVLAEATMYADTAKVPNGAYGIGNPLLAPSGETFDANNNFNLKANGTEGVSTAEIDISSIYNKYKFCMQKVYPKNVKDQMGAHIVLDQTSLNYDGGSCKCQDDVIDWVLPDTDLGLLPYHTEVQNNVVVNVPDGVKRTLENGKITYYRQEAYQMSYTFTLAVEEDGFVSCEDSNSANSISADYAIQTNYSPNQSTNAEHGGTVTYISEGNTNTGHFKSPYIKGLLYNLEFQKVIEQSKVPLEGVTFTIERKSGGKMHSEQVTFFDTQTSGKDGWTKFRNMPWGEYTIKEITYQEGNSFQSDYLKQDLPKEIATVEIGQVINGDALQSDHGSGHECDKNDDVQNQLFLLQGGIVENQPYYAKITIKKDVESYESIADDLKRKSYEMKTTSENIYLKPEKNASKLQYLDQTDRLAHGETITYEVVVPKEGGTICLEEVIPDELKKTIVFKNIAVTANGGSTDVGCCTERNQGCTLEVLPGNDITITVTNMPVGRIYIKKVIDNYQQELVDDEFIIQATSVGDDGAAVNTQVILKHNEISPAIIITNTTSIDITEIIPKEYTLLNIKLSGGGTLKANRITIKPGEEVVVTVCNKYENEPFFHASDTVKNIFNSK